MIDLTIEEENGERMDIRVNEEHKIADTLKILCENGILTDTGERFLYTMRKRGRVYTDMSYREAGIYSGDILYLPG